LTVIAKSLHGAIRSDKGTHTHTGTHMSTTHARKRTHPLK